VKHIETSMQQIWYLIPVTGTDAPTVLLANKYRPVGQSIDLFDYWAGLLLSIRKITLFGKWPALLGNRSAR
jgi:hypothetical protein